MINIPNEVKNLLLVDGVRKNIRIKFPNGERDDICNDSIVQNSVKFTESLCSRDELRFGLCESSVFECELVGIGNIKGMSIFAQMEIDCSSLGETWCDENAQTSEDVDYPYYVLPYGAFIINSCQKQADMSHRKLVAYSVEIGNKLNAIQTDLLSQKLEIEKSRNSSSVYEFNPFMMAMANYGKGFIDSITYNEMESSLGERETEIYFIQDSSQPYGYGTLHNFKINYYYYAFGDASTTYNTNIHKLCYEDVKEINKQIYDEVKNEISDYLDTLSGGYYIPIGGKESALKYDFYNPRDVRNNIIPFFNYLYMQSVIGGASFNQPFWVIVPYKFSIIIRNNKSGYNAVLYEKVIRPLEDVHIYDCIVPFSETISINKTIGTIEDAVDFPNIKETLESVIETGGYFGKFARNGSFDLIAPSSISNLYPSETLYPSNSLYPQGMKGYSVPSTYSNAWYDDELSLPYGRVQAEYTYSWMDGDKEKTEQRVMYLDLVDDYEDNPDKYQIYDFSDNYIIKNSKYTSSTVSEVSEMINRIASKISQIRYMPCDIDGIGMPWLEAGDTIALETTDGDLLKTIILSRTLSGEQYLTDNLSSN